MTDWMAIVAVSTALGVVVGLMGSLQARRERDISPPVADDALGRRTSDLAPSTSDHA
jgi:hypothetical protein